MCRVHPDLSLKSVSYTFKSFKMYFLDGKCELCMLVNWLMSQWLSEQVCEYTGAWNGHVDISIRPWLNTLLTSQLDWFIVYFVWNKYQVCWMCFRWSIITSHHSIWHHQMSHHFEWNGDLSKHIRVLFVLAILQQYIYPPISKRVYVLRQRYHRFR